MKGKSGQTKDEAERINAFNIPFWKPQKGFSLGTDSVRRAVVRCRMRSIRKKGCPVQRFFFVILFMVI